MSVPRVTVAVCTRNRPAELAACVDSILADGSETAFELLVVDNGASAETERVVRARADRNPDVPVRYVAEPRLGVSHARNRAVEEAAGELLMFADDDVVVEPGWVDALAAPFADERVALVTGRVLPLWPPDAPAWLTGLRGDMLLERDLGTLSRELAAEEQPLAGNLAFRVALARRLHPPFDPDLGPRGDRRLQYEEVLFANRLREAHAAWYVAEAVVHHRVDPRRADLDFLRRSFFDLGIGLSRLRRIERRAEPSYPRRVARLWRTYVGARSSALRNEQQPRNGDETADELRAYMWAGKHFELVFGRFPRLSDRLAPFAARKALP